MGESGSGKSTLLNILGFLHAASSGEYIFEGENIADFTDEDALAYIRNRKIGFIFQQFYLMSKLSSVENVSLPAIYAGVMTKKDRNNTAEELLGKVGLGTKLINKP
jgi:putative ABC transport system ATP-binding protein